MASSDLSLFGLRSAPFSKELEDADLWLPESKATIVVEIT
jgi:general secretion pathway protein A